jgi:hypothetical protein
LSSKSLAYLNPGAIIEYTPFISGWNSTHSCFNLASLKVTQFVVLPRKERTHAITPDKMDRASRIAFVAEGEYQKPYPLTEEEATPSVANSEKQSES